MFLYNKKYKAAFDKGSSLSYNCKKGATNTYRKLRIGLSMADIQLCGSRCAMTYIKSQLENRWLILLRQRNSEKRTIYTLMCGRMQAKAIALWFNSTISGRKSLKWSFYEGEKLSYKRE